MIEKFKHKITEFMNCQQGATLVEYGIALTLAIIIGAGAINLLAGEIGAALGVAGASMPN